ncbi:MAG: DUF86 domain-containing protein [Bacteroidales bacterium]|nr:DUF86 domain-containing protein [Bacteroidales bacterium]
MCKKIRVAAYIKTAIEEMELAEQMSEPIIEPDDLGKNLSGMTIFRACSMSIQCITENFIKVRNNTKTGFFNKYNTIPWKEVFGMRNFIAHEYANVDEEAIFATLKNDLPVLKEVSKQILLDLQSGLLDKYI